MRAWWDAVPGAFRVARNPRGQVVAFTILCELADVPQRLLMRDPLCAPWRRHLRAHPVPRGQRVLLARLALAHGTGQAPSPCFAALLRDIERASLEAGPALRRIYSASRGDELLAQLAPLGFVAAPRWRRGRARRRGVPAERLRPRPRVGGRLAVGARRARPARRGHRASTRTRASSSLDGRRVALTKLECDVVRYLREREDQPVAREALLRDVWGYEWTGGSNVVEVTVSGLRRKLGDRAAALETVRGVGYRLRRL